LIVFRLSARLTGWTSVAVLVLLFVCSGWVAASTGHDAPEGSSHAESASATHGDPASTTHGDPSTAQGEGAPASHGGEHEGGSHFHIPSVLDLIIRAVPGGPESSLGKTLDLFAPSIFGVLVAIILAIITQLASRSMTVVPGRVQNVVEMVIGGLADFLEGVLGPQGKKYIPFLGTLFIYIWFMNLIGLVPLMFAPTSRIHMTVALAITVFLFVQMTALRSQGAKGYLFHLAGEPRDAIGWSMMPLMLPLHVIGEIAKPFSLSVRLFGNIFGEETLIAVFVTLGALVLAMLPIPIGIPFHVPFVLLAVLMGTIQAMVFMLLSTIYIALVLPHGEHGNDHH
jgi:F-type H+-transporting ATPase subunit a